MSLMESIRVYSWRPANSRNFGDEIGPMIVRALCKRFGVAPEIVPTTAPTPAKLLAVGSIIHEARGRDVVWGAGINSKNQLAFPKDSDVLFKAVRGPLTRSVVLDHRIHCPPVYGDPGLLFPMLFDEHVRRRRGEIEASAAAVGTLMPHTIIVPNINDDRFLPEFADPFSEDGVMYIRPNLDPITVAAFISTAQRVVSSSLHGLVFADAYGRPTVRMLSQYEPEFKYTDYYSGTGRFTPVAYPNIQSALTGKETEPLDWDPRPLLEAFPLNGGDNNVLNRLIMKTVCLDPDRTYQVEYLSDDESPFDEGWADPEQGSIWSIGTWSTMRFAVETGIGSDAVLRLKAGTLMVGKGIYERLRVVYDGKVISSHRIDRGGPSVMIDIPLPQRAPGGEIALSFRLENPSSPKDFGNSPDARALGIWVSQFEIVSKKEPRSAADR